MEVDFHTVYEKVFENVLLVSFFWLVGVVAQLTLTSCKRESCREQQGKKR